MDESDWIKGIFFSVLASVIGASSKLAIRKSWLLEAERRHGSPVQAVEQDPDNARSSNNNPHAVARPRRAGTARKAGMYASTNLQEDEQDGHDALSSACRAPPPLQQSAGDSPTEVPSPLNVDGNSALNDSFTDDDNDDATGHVYDLPRRAYRHYCTIPFGLRFCGMIGMTFLNPACCLLAMEYATPSILAPFSGLTLVWVIVFSQPLIGEQPSRAQILASSLIVMGEVIVAVFGDHSNDQGTTVADVEASYRDLPFILYFVGLALWMLLLAFWMQPATLRRAPKLTRFAWGCSGGSVTGAAQNFIKDSLVVVKATPQGSHWPWYIPIFIFFAIANSFGGLLLLTATMKRYDATYSAAMFVGSFVVSTSIMSGIHYHTFEHLADVADYVMYPMGLVVLMVGVTILVQATKEHSAPDGDGDLALQQDGGDLSDGNDDDDDGIVSSSDEVTSRTEQGTSLTDDDLELL